MHGLVVLKKTVKLFYNRYIGMSIAYYFKNKRDLVRIECTNKERTGKLKMTAVSNVLRYFSPRIAKALSAVSGNISEIRLRAGEPLAVTLSDKYAYITESGTFASVPEKALRVTIEDIRHCFEAVCVHLTAFSVPQLRKKTGWRIASATLSVLICLSTVFIKQHSVLDLIAGVLLAVLLSLPVMLRNRRIIQNDRTSV